MPFTVTGMINEYSLACLHTRMASTSYGAVFMPTFFMISCLHQKNEPVITTTREAAEIVDVILDDYEILCNNQADFVLLNS